MLLECTDVSDGCVYLCVRDREWIEAGHGVAIRAQMIIIDFIPDYI